jgi:hypothetical protein
LNRQAILPEGETDVTRLGGRWKRDFHNIVEGCPGARARYDRRAGFNNQAYPSFRFSAPSRYLAVNFQTLDILGIFGEIDAQKHVGIAAAVSHLSHERSLPVHRAGSLVNPVDSRPKPFEIRVDHAVNGR